MSEPWRGYDSAITDFPDEGDKNSLDAFLTSSLIPAPEREQGHGVVGEERGTRGGSGVLSRKF